MLYSLLIASLQVPAPTAALDSVAFVGTPDTPRTAAFVTFLEERFDEVTFHDRTTVDPKAAATADVVLLDWDQENGVLKWFQDREYVLEHPFGELADWRTPTVLLGSAGLNTAAAWDVRGGSG